jgi:hypothetical protein
VASLEKQPALEPKPDGPAEQAGVFLENTGSPEHRTLIIDLGTYVLHDTVSLITEPDPINTLRRVDAACREFGDDLRMIAEPSGTVHIFVPEEAQEIFQQKEAQRIEERIPQEIKAHSPLPASEAKS